MTSHQPTGPDLKKFIETTIPVAEGIDVTIPAEIYRARFATGVQQKQDWLQAKAQGKQADEPQSGLSFGRFQHDVATNRAARKLFGQILDAWPYFQQNPADRTTAFMKASDHSVTKPEFQSTGLLDEVNAALANSSALIDQADNKQLHVLVGAIDKGLVNSPAPPIGRGVFEPSHPDYLIAVGYVAAWNNRVRDINSLVDYMRGNEVEWGREKHKLTAAPTLQDVIDYIGTQLEFRYDKHDQNRRPEVDEGKFGNWQLLVAEGVIEGYKQLGLPKPNPSAITLRLSSKFPKDIHNVKNQPAGTATPASPAGLSPAQPAQSPKSTLTTPVAPPPGRPAAPPSHSVPPSPFAPMLPLTPQSFPGGSGTELEEDGRQASVADEPPVAPAAPQPSSLRSILARAKQRAGRALTRLTPTAFARTSATMAGVDPKLAALESGGAEASLPAVLPALDEGTTIDLGRADAGQLDAGQMADSPDAESHLIAASFDTPSVSVGALADAATTQPKRPTSVTVGGRVFTREEIMAQTTISADGRSAKWTIPQPGDTPEAPGLTERMKEQVRELISEELSERDWLSGVRYRSTHRFRRR